MSARDPPGGHSLGTLGNSTAGGLVSSLTRHSIRLRRLLVLRISCVFTCIAIVLFEGSIYLEFRDRGTV